MFKDADQAIRFAFNMRGNTVMSRVKFDSIDSPGSTARDKMTAYDFHAMAAMINAFIARQPAKQQAAVFLFYGNKKERLLAAEVLADGSVLPKYITNQQQLKYAIAARTVRELSRECGVSHYKAWMIRKSVWGLVEPHLIEAQEGIEGRFGIAN